MTNWEKTTELIERFLDGELSGEERSDFLKEVDSDPLLAAELDFHKNLRKGIRTSGEEKKFRTILTEIHAELEGDNTNNKEKKEKKVLNIKYVNKRIYRSLAYAALIALLISSGSTLAYYLIFSSTQNPEFYTELRRIIQENRQLKKFTVATDSIGENQDQEKEKDLKHYAATTFAINDSGYLVTSYHVIRDAKDIDVEIRKDSVLSYHAILVAGDDLLDLALLKISDKNFKGYSSPVPFVFSEKESVLGENVYTLGFPRDDIVYGEGTVSALTGFEQDTLAYQVSIPVNPGNSGAPLINDRGEINGIITAKNSGEEGASFAIKSSFFHQFINSVNQDTNNVPVLLPDKNMLRWLKRTQQLDKIKDYVFILKITCDK